MIKYFKLFIFLFSFSLPVFSQNTITDSLKKIALRVDKDSSAKLYAKIANIFTGVNSDSVRKYALIAGKLSSINSVTKGDALIQMGNSYHMENKVDSALSYYNKALLHFQKTGNEKGIGKVYQSYAIVKRTLGDYEGSIADSKKALVAFEKINWSLGKVNAFNNLSNTYGSINKHTEAVLYSRKALSEVKLLNDSMKYYFTLAEYGGKLILIDKLDLLFSSYNFINI